MKTLLGILGCGFFLFITLNRLSHSLLICTVSAEITLKPYGDCSCMLFVAFLSLFFTVLGAESSLLHVGFL